MAVLFSDIKLLGDTLKSTILGDRIGQKSRYVRIVVLYTHNKLPTIFFFHFHFQPTVLILHSAL